MPHTLVVWGIIQGVIGVVAAQWLRMPPEDYQPRALAPPTARPSMQTRRSYTPRRDAAEPDLLAAVRHDER